MPAGELTHYSVKLSALGVKNKESDHFTLKIAGLKWQVYINSYPKNSLLTIFQANWEPKNYVKENKTWKKNPSKNFQTLFFLYCVHWYIFN